MDRRFQKYNFQTGVNSRFGHMGLEKRESKYYAVSNLMFYEDKKQVIPGA